jgi:hypothetical protein
VCILFRANDSENSRLHELLTQPLLDKE